MVIRLSNISKKFAHQWIFRNINLEFKEGIASVITGPNGSGKSTLISVIAGYLLPTSGDVFYTHDTKEISPDDFYRYTSIAAPYLELIEEFTLSELIDFHFKFTPFLPDENKQSLLEFVKLEHARNKPIKFFSSGMKQRVKLGLALFSDKPVLLLDEPTVNLDNDGIRWYREAIPFRIKNRVTVLSSNMPYEYEFSTNIYSITDFQ